MPRNPRSHLPGAVFHLTARTLGRRGRFTEAVRSRIEGDIAEVFARSDARLLAYCIMSNHLHLVVRQGRKPLDRCMQPLLRRIALRVQRAHRTTGHVFEGRFRDSPCLDPHYLRNAILYTHLNPVRPGIVAAPGEYAWSSHAFYSRDSGAARAAEPLASVLAADLGLTLFAPSAAADREALRASYDAFVAWRLERDAFEDDDPASPPPEPPPVLGGHDPWSRAFPEFAMRPDFGTDDTARGRRCQRTDLSDIAKRTLAALRLDLELLDLVRSGCKARGVVRARREIVLRAHDAGHPNHAIVRYLRVSPQCVSAIIVRRQRSRSR